MPLAWCLGGNLGLSVLTSHLPAVLRLSSGCNEYQGPQGRPPPPLSRWCETGQRSTSPGSLCAPELWTEVSLIYWCPHGNSPASVQISQSPSEPNFSFDRRLPGWSGHLLHTHVNNGLYNLFSCSFCFLVSFTRKWGAWDHEISPLFIILNRSCIYIIWSPELS